MEYDLIGTICRPSGVMLTDEFGNEYQQMLAIDGYHVNVITDGDMSLVEPYVIVSSALRRVFAGRDDTVALKFANRDEWLSLGIEVLPND